MTHFNHEWDTTKTPAVPVSVGDRYYAQDLNDDFNYLKHLPYEVFLQGRSRGVMIAPNDTWDNDNNILTLSGGFGAVSQDCIELDPNEDFVIPPKTHSSPRYERIPFADTVLVLPNDGATHYIVATPTKRSLLQRTKALFTEQYASRIRYDGVITIQDTTPTTGQILVGLCRDKEYCLLIDNNPDQCKDDIILKKWFAQNKITSSFISILQSYYNTSTASIKTKISINTISDYGIYNGTYNDCIISIGTVNVGTGIRNGAFSNCTITIEIVNGNSHGVSDGAFSNCTITTNTVNSNNYGRSINGGTFNDCTITVNTVTGGAYSRGIGGGTFNNCTITIGTTDSGISILDGTFNNCTINITTINGGRGIGLGTFSDCIITIGTISSNSRGINGGTFNDCTIGIDTVNGTDGYGIINSTFNDCTITIGTVNNIGRGIVDSTFNSCTININTIGIYVYGITNSTFNDCAITIDTINADGYGIFSGTFNDCAIGINTVNGTSIRNNSSVYLYLTRIVCSAITITNLSSITGKVNVLNDTSFVLS